MILQGTRMMDCWSLAFKYLSSDTTVLPCLINLPILRTFLAPLWAGMQTGITVRAFLNGIALAHHLVTCESGFYLRVTLEGSSSFLVSQIEHMAFQLPHPPIAPIPDDLYWRLHP